jgi:hypothetical protein
MKIDNRWFDNLLQLKHFGTTVTIQSMIKEEIKRRFNSGNACYHSILNLSSISLQSKNVKIRIIKTIILPVFVFRCKTWSLTLREEHWVRILQNGVRKGIFGLKRNEVTGSWRGLHNE